MLWAENNLMDLKAVYLPGRLNQEADRLPQKCQDASKWSLHPMVFNWMVDHLVLPEDLFALAANAKLPRLISRLPHHQTEAVDAFLSPWSCTWAYAFPPCPLISRFLTRLLSEPISVIAVLLYWPRHPCFPLVIHLSTQCPVRIPIMPRLFSQGDLSHPNPLRLNLEVWILEGKVLNHWDVHPR